MTEKAHPYTLSNKRERCWENAMSKSTGQKKRDIADKATDKKVTKEPSKKSRHLCLWKKNRHSLIHSSLIAVVVVVVVAVAGVGVVVVVAIIVAVGVSQASSCGGNGNGDNDDDGSKDPPHNASNVTTQSKVCIGASWSVIPAALRFTSLGEQAHTHTHTMKWERGERKQQLHGLHTSSQAYYYKSMFSHGSLCKQSKKQHGALELLQILTRYVQ